MSIAFECEQCGKHYEVGDELAARRARCSGCQTVFRVPTPTSLLTSSAGEESLLAALFEEEFGPAEDDAKPCPSCTAPLSTTAVLCIECGYHVEKRQKIVIDRQEVEDEVRPDEPANQSARVARNLAKQRKVQTGFSPASYIRGTLISLVFALIGGTLWAFASLTTDYALGFLAWAVGGLAGLGMALGHQDGDGTLAGITSALMALVGCIFSKVLYFALFLSAFAGMTNDDLHHYAANILAEEQIRVAGQDPDEVDEAYFDQKFQLAMQEIKTWDATKIDRQIELHKEADRPLLIERLLTHQQVVPQENASKLAEYNAIIQRVTLLSDAEVVAELESTPALAASTPEQTQAADQNEQARGFKGTTAIGLFFLALLAFGIFGGVFLVLGMISAYRLGSGNLAA